MLGLVDAGVDAARLSLLTPTLQLSTNERRILTRGPLQSQSFLPRCPTLRALGSCWEAASHQYLSAHKDVTKTARCRIDDNEVSTSLQQAALSRRPFPLSPPQSASSIYPPLQGIAWPIGRAIRRKSGLLQGQVYASTTTRTKGWGGEAQSRAQGQGQKSDPSFEP